MAHVNARLIDSSGRANRMMSAKVTRRLEWILLALVVVVHGWFYVLGFMDRPQSQGWATLSDALRIAQPALLTIFTLLGLGPRWWPIGGALFVGWWYVVLQIVPDERFGLPTIVATEVACLAVVLLVVRLCGLAIRKVDFGEPVGPRWRFSMRALVIFITLAAVVVRLAMVLRDWSASLEVLPRMLSLASFGGVFAAVALLVLWLTFTPGRIFWRICALLPLTALLGVVPPLLFARADPAFLEMAMLSVTMALVMIATILILRLCGYRLCYPIAPTTDQPQPRANLAVAATPAATTVAM